jgi:hypothetical protein
MKRSNGMEKSLKRPPLRESGVALVFVMLVLLSLSALIISAHYTTVSQTQSTANYRNATQAYYIAEAGIQRTIDWFSHKYTPPDWTITTLNRSIYPNLLDGSGERKVILKSEETGSTFPISSIISDFQSYLQLSNNLKTTATPGLEGHYIVETTLLSTRMVNIFLSGLRPVERWRIKSRGIIRSSERGNELARADNIAVIETLVGPAFTHAICADGYDLNGSPTIDSYDSSSGLAYGETNSDGVTNSGGPASVGSYNDSAGPFDFGNIDIGGAIDIPPAYHSETSEEPCNQADQGCGTNYCPDFPPVPNFTTVTNGKSAPYYAYSSADCTFEPTKPGSCPGVIPDATGKKIEVGTISLAKAPGFTGSGPASFWADEIGKGVTIDNATGRTGDGPLNIFVNRINGSVNIINRAPAEKNPVNIFVKDEIRMSGNDNINGNTGLGVNTLGLTLLLSPGVKFTISGNSTVTGIVYGPNQKIDVGNGKVDFYGAVIGGDEFIKNGSNGGIHFDRRLEGTGLMVFNFVPTADVRRIY